ncbi:MAG: hypothetical protein ACI4MK_01445 [Aristaeellaceae bacterium]
MTLRRVRWMLLIMLGLMGVAFMTMGLALGATMKGYLPWLATMVDDPAEVPVAFGVLTGLGAVMAVVGVGLFIGMGRGERRREELLTWGTQVDATVEKVAQNRLLQVNGRNPWYVVVTCRHPVTRENVQLRSHYVFQLTVQPGDHVRVAFDPMDERKYAVILPEGKARA